jgi:hypothetical protein
MADENLIADTAFVFLRDVYTREGADAAVRAAKDLISAGAGWITQVHGPEEARRILQAVGSTEGEAHNPGYCQDADAPSHSPGPVHYFSSEKTPAAGGLIAAGVATPAPKRGDHLT